MTGLLVSVRNVAEASLAADLGVAIVDIKEPTRGSLGRADSDQIQEIVSSLEGRVPVSVALGELIDLKSHDFQLPDGITFIKLGLAQAGNLSDWRTKWSAALDWFPDNIQRVAVAYADWHQACSPPPYDVLDHAIETRCPVFLIDTHSKIHGNLFAFVDLDEIRQLIGKAHSHGIRIALAGSIGEPEIESLLPLGPDLIAVRGAVCACGRNSPVDAELTRKLVHFIETHREERIQSTTSSQVSQVISRSKSEDTIDTTI